MKEGKGSFLFADGRSVLNNICFFESVNRLIKFYCVFHVFVFIINLQVGDMTNGFLPKSASLYSDVLINVI